MPPINLSSSSGTRVFAIEGDTKLLIKLSTCALSARVHSARYAACVSLLYVVVQVRASAALELGQVVKEVRRQVEKEKEIAISETKKKKWVSHILRRW